MAKTEQQLPRHYVLKVGLSQLYTAQMLAVAAMVLVLIPLVGLVALVMALVAVVMSLLAILKLKGIHRDYQTALNLVAASMVLGFAAIGVGESLLGTLVELLSSVLELGEVYFIIRATNFYMEELGAEEVMKRGEKAWKIYLVTAVMGMALELVNLALGAALSGLVMALAVLVVSIWGLLVFIRYLKAAKTAVPEC